MEEDTPPGDSLVVRHFPSEFSDDDKRNFFEYFGAVDIKILKSKINKYNLIFARFPNKYHAAAVLQKIHQSKLGSSRLSAEFALKEKESVSSSEGKSPPQDDKKKAVKREFEATSKSVKLFLNSMNSWLAGVNYKVPPPSHLRYQYPPPSPDILENIMKALVAVPKFYTQVLHLMNKMNLPSPFEADYPIICDNLFSITKPSYKPEPRMMSTKTEEKTEINDEESEMESSDEDDARAKREEIIPNIRLIHKKQLNLDRSKVLKSKLIEKSLPSRKIKKLKTEHVFETAPVGPSQRTIQVKLITPDLSSLREKEQETVTVSEGGFGILNVPSLPSDEAEESVTRDEREEEIDVDTNPCITEKELAENRLSKANYSILPVFKNYSPGTPSCRLYIKNLAKKVTLVDLQHIYRRYFLKYHEEQGSMFDVRLMQEGRMKGQAFVNLQTIDQAKKAVEETNGFILKDKPMVVQFARCAPQNKADEPS